MPKKRKRPNKTGSVFFDKHKKLWVAKAGMYDDSTGKLLSIRRRFRTKTEAELGLANLLTELGQGEVVAPDKVTVKELLKGWLEWKSPDLRPTTRASYERAIRLYLEPKLGRMRVQALSKADIERAYELMRQPREDHRKNGKTFVPSVESIRVVNRVLKQALKEWGVGREVIIKNPAEEVKLPKVRAQRGEEGGGRAKYEPYSDAELRKFLNATFDHHLFIAFFLAGALGLREGEVAGLRWNHLAIEPQQLSPQGEGQLRIREQRTRVGGKVIEGPPKSERSARPVPLSAKAVQTLRLHRKQQQEWAKTYGWVWRNDGYVVAKLEDGTPIRPDSIWRRFRALTNKLGLRPVAFHDLRHGYVSIMASQGIPLEVISKLVGHHSAAFTADSYRHIFDTEGLAATKAMDNLSPEVGGILTLPHSVPTPEEQEEEAMPSLVGRKLTPGQAHRVKERIEAGERPEDVAKDYAISSRMARFIHNGERYTWLVEQRRTNVG